VSLILDAGALLAYGRGDNRLRAWIRQAKWTSTDMRTTTGAVAQVWRNGAQQAHLATLLRSVFEVELGRTEARRIGTLLGRCRSTDVVDGSIMDAAVDGDEILTSDPDDIAALSAACGKRVIITRV